MVVNREGFVPEKGFYDLKKMVKEEIWLREYVLQRRHA
jgi:hypothetical protein